MGGGFLRRRTCLFAGLVVARYAILDSAVGGGPPSPPPPASGGRTSGADGGDPPSSLFLGPSYEVVTTNYGWNTPSGASFSRSILSGEFFRAARAHPRHNASAWADLEARPDPARQVVAFVDVDTCIETNYPVYGAPDWHVNIEEGHPRPGRSAVGIVGQSCQYLKRAASSPALTANPDSRLVLLDCGGVRKVQLQYACNDPSVFRNDQVVVAYYCIEKRQVRPLVDVGLPPPAIKSVNLTASERNDVRLCKKRKYLFSFQGRGGFGREKLLAFQNDTEMHIRIFAERTAYLKDIRKEDSGANDHGPVEDSNNYKGILSQSTFAASPRGDLLFSYRFSEILSAGAVPVVYADGWLPPYHPRVVDWSECAVFVAESDYGRTGEILRAIPEERRCEMQRCALDVWDRLAADRAGWVRGLVASALSTTAFGADPLESAL